MTASWSLAENVPLRERNTFRVEATAQFFATVRDAAALPELLDDPRVRGLPRLVLGEGSNVLFAEPRHHGLIVHLGCAGASVIAEDDLVKRVRVEAACRWDTLVDWTLARGLQGLENLALIPGQSGAAPIQNIGAYGVEAGEMIEAVEAWDEAARKVRRLKTADCGFGYRDSAFKREPDRWIVTAVELELRTHGEPRVDYAGIREELGALGHLPATPANVATAVRNLRRRKLPDPAQIGNAGSFFKNPVVEAGFAAALAAQYPGLPVHAAARPSDRKLSAAWLIERDGWRGFREGAAGISGQHALVLVNHGGATGGQLLDVARRVADSVERRFGVRLEPEPRIVGASF
jgi:UDP-N-acetylmuramate dehydrogenase